MKTLNYYLLAFALFVSTIALQAAPNYQPELIPQPLPILSELTLTDGLGPIVRVEIGRKKFDCRRFGICRVIVEDADIPVGAYPASGNSARGTATVNSGKLTVAFYRASMASDTYMTYFGGDTFIMEEDYEVPSDVSNTLGVKSYTIKAGLYPVSTTDNNTVSVTF